MSDSTIDDALKLLEIGKGNPDRLKQIIESFQKRSMISMQDRKYVDALVEQYLTPRHRQMTRKMNISEKETKFPRIRKSTESSFKITEVKTTFGNPNIKPSKNREIPQASTSNEIPQASTSNEIPQASEQELASKEPTIEEKFIEHIETDRTTTKKSNKGKVTGIIIGVIAAIIIGGGAAYMSTGPELFSSNVEIEERITCENSVVLVSSTKVCLLYTSPSPRDS